MREPKLIPKLGLEFSDGGGQRFRCADFNSRWNSWVKSHRKSTIRAVGKKAWDEETHRNSSTIPCPICTFFERDDAGYHPLPNSLLGEVLYASIAGMDVRRIAERVDRGTNQVPGALRTLRRKGALPTSGRRRGRPRRVA